MRTHKFVVLDDVLLNEIRPDPHGSANNAWLFACV